MRWLFFLVLSGCTQDFDRFLGQDLEKGDAAVAGDAGAGVRDARREADPPVVAGFVLDGPFTWDQAKDACAAAGGQLATFANDEERRALTAFGSGERWVGLHRKGNRWEWVTGGDASYTPWAPGEPNGNGDDRCARVKNDGLLYDIGCDTRLAALCERP
jgi:hypothetical protein